MTGLDSASVDKLETHSQAVKLAAVYYRDGEGGVVDRLIAAAANRLRGEGLRLAGVIQHNTDCGERSCCTMTLEELASSRLIKISEDRGPHATGCRLDTRALEEAVGLAGAAIDEGADLLIVNKFGKRECEGHGFRATIDAALTAGIPVLAGVNEQSADGWIEYAQDFSHRLPLDEDAVFAWLLGAVASSR